MLVGKVVNLNSSSCSCFDGEKKELPFEIDFMLRLTWHSPSCVRRFVQMKCNALLRYQLTILRQKTALMTLPHLYLHQV